MSIYLRHCTISTSRESSMKVKQTFVKYSHGEIYEKSLFEIHYFFFYLLLFYLFISSLLTNIFPLSYRYNKIIFFPTSSAFIANPSAIVL